MLGIYQLDLRMPLDSPAGPVFGIACTLSQPNGMYELGYCIGQDCLSGLRYPGN
jgi:hypothetical protein